MAGGAQSLADYFVFPLTLFDVPAAEQEAKLTKP